MRSLPALRVRSGRERGAAVAEMAIVFPVFALFLFGVLDFGINWQHRLQTTHAAREVARAASVARMGEDTTCAPVGLSSPPSLLHQTICLAKRKTGMDPGDVRVKVFYMDEDGKLTADEANPKDSVVVCVMSKSASSTLLLAPIFNGKAFRSRSVIKTAKPYGGTPVQSGQETALPGFDWTWCKDDHPGAP